MRKATKICIANQKGGVGKTTSTFCLATAKARAGKMTLMIDIDPQFSLTVSCGMEPDDPGYEGNSTCSLFKKGVNPLDCCFKVASLKYDNLFIVPSSQQLAVTANKLALNSAGIFAFKENIEFLSKYFDYIFFDCPPSLDQLLTSSLISSDKVIIPVKPEKLSYIGIDLISETIKAVQEDANSKLKVAGTLVTMYRRQSVEHNKYLEIIKNDNRDLLGVIPLSTIVTKELPYGRPCVDAHPTAAPSKAYIEVANKI